MDVYYSSFSTANLSLDLAVRARTGNSIYLIEVFRLYKGFTRLDIGELFINDKDILKVENGDSSYHTLDVPLHVVSLLSRID